MKSKLMLNWEVPVVIVVQVVMHDSFHFVTFVGASLRSFLFVGALCYVLFGQNSRIEINYYSKED